MFQTEGIGETLGEGGLATSAPAVDRDDMGRCVSKAANQVRHSRVPGREIQGIHFFDKLTTIRLQSRHLPEDTASNSGCEHLSLDGAGSSAWRFSPLTPRHPPLVGGSSTVRLFGPSATTRS